MNKFSLVKFCLIAVGAVQIGGSQHMHTKKCAKTPDTWKKVDAAIKECQDDVKQKIIQDTFYSNEWDDSIFDYDGNFPDSPGHEEHHHSIIDHSGIYDEHSHGHGHHIVDHHTHIHDHNSQANEHFPHHVPIHDHHPQVHDPQVQDHHPQIQDHHPQIQDHHPQIQDHHPLIKDYHQQIQDHNPQMQDHHTQVQDHHQQIQDHHSQMQDHHPQIQDHNPLIQDHHPQIKDHHPQMQDHNPLRQDHLPQIKDHHPQMQDDHTPIHDSVKVEHFPTLLRYETLGHHPHDHSTKAHHSHDVHQIEAPLLKNPQPFLLSTHSDSTQNAVHMPGTHVDHTNSLSENPVEQDHYIDLNFFRKKRYTSDHEHIHSSTVTYHDKRIAGCIMQCIYEKNHATDTLGWPTLDGLVNFYSEGVDEHGYFMATLRAVDYCLKGSSAKYHVNRRSTPEKGQTCDVAFDVFDCISDQITEYCSDHHHSD